MDACWQVHPSNDTANCVTHPSGVCLNYEQETIMKTVWMATATGMLLSSAAMAQTPTTPLPAQPTQAQPQVSSTATPGAKPQQQIKADLLKAGFTDVTMMPDSFLVQAKDKSGAPVVMMIKPDSVAEVVDLGGATPNQAGMAGGTFTTVPAAGEMSSKVVGLDVHNNADQDIGSIKDIAYNGSAIKAYIIGVGGFLGMGDHYVAVNPSSVRITYDANAKTWHATMNTTADQLKAAPEFKYPSQA
jgi:hypothetical protein